MAKELTPEEVAILIASRKIINAKGLPRDVDVTGICNLAGISRKTGYQWADNRETREVEAESLKRELACLKEEHEKLKRLFDDVRFENEGRKLAWKIHGVDKLLAEKKTLRDPGEDGSDKISPQ
jgi:hypothetical protein